MVDFSKQSTVDLLAFADHPTVPTFQPLWDWAEENPDCQKLTEFYVASIHVPMCVAAHLGMASISAEALAWSDSAVQSFTSAMVLSTAIMLKHQEMVRSCPEVYESWPQGAIVRCFGQAGESALEAITNLSCACVSAIGMSHADLQGNSEHLLSMIQSKELGDSDLLTWMVSGYNALMDTVFHQWDLGNGAAMKGESDAAIMQLKNEFGQVLKRRKEPKQTKKRVGEGMSWQRAKEKAEEHIRAHQGAFPSVKRLAESVGCSRATIEKAVEPIPKPFSMLCV